MKNGISGSTLKIMALVSMIISHCAIVLIEGKGLFTDLLYGHNWFILYEVMKLVGRIAFPIYCFLLVEGYFHTSNVRRYIVRMAVFALISEVPFDMAIYSTPLYLDYHNIFFTLCLGLIAITLYDRTKGADIWSVVKKYMFLGAALVIAQYFSFDYGAVGILMIYAFYYFRNSEWQRDIAVTALGLQGITTPLALIPIHFYNGRRGLNIKWLFYAAYPVHLLILAML